MCVRARACVGARMCACARARACACSCVSDEMKARISRHLQAPQVLTRWGAITILLSVVVVVVVVVLVVMVVVVVVVVAVVVVVVVYSVDIVYFWQYVAEQTADKHKRLLAIKH